MPGFLRSAEVDSGVTELARGMYNVLFFSGSLEPKGEEPKTTFADKCDIELNLKVKFD
jgi:hypothetical protein